MDVKRAEEIISSENKIEVIYRDKPVWLEDVMDGEKVYVTIIGSCQTMEVPVADLVETGTIE